MMYEDRKVDVRKFVTIPRSIGTIFILGMLVVSANAEYPVVAFPKVSTSSDREKQVEYITHSVRRGETLQMIISRYYKLDSSESQDVRKMIVEHNPHAFRQGNPHYMFANASIKIAKDPRSYDSRQEGSRGVKDGKQHNKGIYYFSR